jgi:hypothetical protein
MRVGANGSRSCARVQVLHLFASEPMRRAVPIPRFVVPPRRNSNHALFTDGIMQQAMRKPSASSHCPMRTKPLSEHACTRTRMHAHTIALLY